MLNCYNEKYNEDFSQDILFNFIDIVWSLIQNPKNFVNKKNQNEFLEDYEINKQNLLSYIRSYVLFKITDEKDTFHIPFEKNLSDFIFIISDKTLELFCQIEMFIRYYKNQNFKINFENFIKHHVKQSLIFMSFEPGKINIKIDQSSLQQFITKAALQNNNSNYNFFLYFIFGAIVAFVLVLLFIFYYCLASKPNYKNSVASKNKAIKRSKKRNASMTPDDNHYTIEDNGFTFYEKKQHTVPKYEINNVNLIENPINEPVYENSLVLNDLKNIDLILNANKIENNIYEEIQ